MSLTSYTTIARTKPWWSCLCARIVIRVMIHVATCYSVTFVTVAVCAMR